MTSSYSKIQPDSRYQLRHQDKYVRSNDPGYYGPDTFITILTQVGLDRWTNSIQGTRNPGWQDRIKKGYDANSSMSANRTTFRVFGRSGSAHAYRKNVQGSRWLIEENIVRYGLGTFGAPTLSIDNSVKVKAMDLAKTRFLQRARQAQTAFTGGVYLGEAKEAIRMLTGGTRDISKRLNRWLTDDVRRPAKRVNRLPLKKRKKEYNSALANQWLQLNYGILPLANDVKSAAEALARLHNDDLEPSVSVRSRGVAKAQSYSAPQSGGVSTVPRFDWTFRTRADDLVTLQLRGRVKCKREGLTGVLQYLGLDIQDFVPTVYELIPYSFLLDYFTNVNEIVNAYSFFSSNLEWCWQTERLQRTRRFDDFALDINQFNSNNSVFEEKELVLLSRPTLECEVKSVSRQNHGRNLIPSFTFEIPGAKDWRKWTNMSALARNSKLALRFINRVLN